MKTTANRRAHFPVGGKRNTMNFFGHGNRPKKKGKTAADDDDDEDSRPRRHRRKGSTSNQWAILAAIGVMGAAGTYWAFQNPKQIRAAAKALGIADNETIAGALDALDPKKPEDRVAKEAELARATAVEHGHAAPEITTQNPTGRATPRELNKQEVAIITGLQAEHPEAAAQLAESWKLTPDHGVLEMPRAPTGDPVRDASTYLTARAQFDGFRRQAESGARFPAAQHGASKAEIEQLAKQTTAEAHALYKDWVRTPADPGDIGARMRSAPLSTLVRQAFPGASAQGWGSKELFDAQVEANEVGLTNGPDSGATAVANRNLRAQARDVASSHPATSPLGASGDHLDQALTALSPRILGQANMALSSGVYGADARGILNPQGDPNSSVIRDPRDHWQANRARAVLDRQNAVQEARAAGDHDGARMLLAEPLPGSTETLADIEAANRGAELHDTAGRASSALALSTALRVSAPHMGPGGVLAMGGALSSVPVLKDLWHGKPVADTPEAQARLTGAAGGIGGFAAQTAVMRSRPQIVAQTAWNELNALQDKLRGVAAKQGPGAAYDALAKQIEQQTGKLNTALQAAKAAPGVGAVPESLHGIRMGAAEATRAEILAAQAANPGANALSRAGTKYGARASNAVKSGFQQAKWVGSLSTPAEATAALGRISQTALKSPALISLMRVNALRSAGALSVATIQYGTIATGAQAAADLAGHALNWQQGGDVASSRSADEQYHRAFEGTLLADGRLESEWGTGGYLGNARDVGATARNVVGGDFDYIMKRQAAVTGYSRAKFEGGSHDIIRAAGAARSGVNDPETGYYRESAEYRGVQDAMYLTAERRALQRGTEIATQIIEGDPRFAGADVATRDGAIFATAARISAQYVGRLQGTTILENNIDEAIGALDHKVKSFKVNPAALLESSGDQVYNEGTRFLEHILPGDDPLNTALQENINSVGHLNAARRSGLQDVDKLVREGRGAEIYAASNDYAWENRAKMSTLPGGIGDAFKAHEAMYGPTRRAVERALEAPELRDADPKRRQAIMDAAMKGVEAKAKPMVEDFLKSRDHGDIAKLLESQRGPDGARSPSRLEAWKQSAGIQESRRDALGISGSAEAARDTGLQELRAVLPQEAQGLLDPAAIQQEADRNTAKTFDQRNNTEAGLYTASSQTGQAVAARREQWAQDLQRSGVRLPLDDVRFQQFRDTTERDDQVTAYSIDTPTWNRAAKLSYLEDATARNPEAIRQLNRGPTDITPVLLAQERPVLEQALRGPQGFTKLGPDGKPAGTAGTWEEIAGDISANPANYAKAWRPEVQKYQQDYQAYRARRDAPRPEATPEITGALGRDSAYERLVATERNAYLKAHPAAPPEAQPQWPLAAEVAALRTVLRPPRNPLQGWKPSMTPEAFDQVYREDPAKFQTDLPPAAAAHRDALKSWEARDVRAPAGPGATPRYAPAPKPAPVVAAVPPPPPLVPLGQPAKP